MPNTLFSALPTVLNMRISGTLVLRHCCDLFSALLAGHHAEEAAMSRLSYEAYVMAKEERQQSDGRLTIRQVVKLAFVFSFLVSICVSVCVARVVLVLSSLPVTLVWWLVGCCPPQILPITDVAGYKYFPSQMLPVTDVAHHRCCRLQMLPVTDVAGYRFFPSQMLPVTDVAGYRFFRSQMLDVLVTVYAGHIMLQTAFFFTNNPIVLLTVTLVVDNVFVCDEWSG